MATITVSWSTPADPQQGLPKRTSGWSRAQPRIRAGEGFIYLAECLGTGEIKIGFSLNPTERVKNAGFNRKKGKCLLLAMVPGTFLQEKALHRELGYGDGEFYPRTILDHPAIPAELRSAA